MAFGALAVDSSLPSITGADPERLVTRFLGDLKFLGPRPFPVWATPFFFPKCPSSCGHSLYSLYEV